MQTLTKHKNQEIKTMNDGASAKQQIVESIKKSSNILVTLSTDPTVDELSAALGLTLMLNNMKKHATAVVSGTIPPAITFLDPEKTFEDTVDSLRDFIIALDKEKADHLRYKVDGDVVKIFITPYRTTISDADLDFSQGDYNVELVLALGVKTKENLDKALEAHGRILHDATVATLTCGDEASELGSIDWYESGASSISEMLVSLSEALKSDKPVLDEQIATAFLTGIVAATDRFSNDKTSSKVMTMAAQLMAAGANQQLIAAKLEEAHEITTDAPSDNNDKPNSDGTTDLSEDTTTKVDKKPPKPAAPAETKKAKTDDGSLSISHENLGTLDEVAAKVHSDNTQAAAEKAEDILAGQLGTVAPATAATPSVADLQKDLAAASADVDEAATEEVSTEPVATTLPELAMPDYEPTMGGTLNATSQQAAEDKRHELENEQNKTILSHAHGQLSTNSKDQVFAAPPFNASSEPESPDEDKIAAPTSEPATPPPSALPPLPPPLPDPVIQEPAHETLADLDQKNRAPHDEARAAVHAAFGSVQNDAAPTSAESTNVPPATADNGLPPLPDFSTLPPPPPPPAPFTQPVAPAPLMSEEPEQLGQIFGSTPVAPVASSEPADPNQFKIPGQN